MKLLPVLTGRSAPNQSERDLFALPVQMGGLAVVNPAELAASEFSTSGKITEPLTNAIMERKMSYSYDVIYQLTAKTEVSTQRRNRLITASAHVKECLSSSLR